MSVVLSFLPWLLLPDHYLSGISLVATLPSVPTSLLEQGMYLFTWSGLLSIPNFPFRKKTFEV